MSISKAMWLSVVSTFALTFLAVRSFKKSKKSPILLLTSSSPHNTDLALVRNLITSHADFPLPGVLFQNIFPIFMSPTGFPALLRLLHNHIRTLPHIDLVIGLDARGFLFGPILAGFLNCNFAPIRKKGKLPGEVQSVSYEKEYGSDTFEIPVQAIPRPGYHVLIIDDLLATGGTLLAACQLVHKLQGVIVECAVIIELSDLGGRERVKSLAPVWSLYEY